MQPNLTTHLNTSIVSVSDNSSELVTLQIMFNVGSVNESITENGISHLIEHMLFKGSQKYSSREISYGVEFCGGEINAYTTKEYTTFYIHGYHKHLITFTDILFDLCFFPLFIEEDLEKEKDVVINEILSVEDSPDEFLSELIESTVYKDHPLGKPIAGVVEGIKSITIDQLKAFHHQHFNLKNCIVGVAGRFDIDNVYNAIESVGAKSCGDVVSPGCFESIYEQVVVQKMHVEQAYMAKVYDACDLYSENRFAYYAISYMLASSMSSRLFQEVREKHGLCYNIDSEVSLFRDAGYFSIFVDALPQNIGEIRELICLQNEDILQDGFRGKELEMAKNLLMYNLMGIYESYDSMLASEMKHVLYHNKLIEKDDLATCIHSISLEKVNGVANTLFRGRETECILLPFG